MHFHVFWFHFGALALDRLASGGTQRAGKLGRQCARACVCVCVRSAVCKIKRLSPLRSGKHVGTPIWIIKSSHITAQYPSHIRFIENQMAQGSKFNIIWRKTCNGIIWLQHDLRHYDRLLYATHCLELPNPLSRNNVIFGRPGLWLLPWHFRPKNLLTWAQSAPIDRVLPNPFTNLLQCLMVKPLHKPTHAQPANTSTKKRLRQGRKRLQASKLKIP